MGYEKLKIEQYNNLGGLQEKAAKSNIQDDQFLNVRNYSYERPGALVSRNGYEAHASLPFATFLAHPANFIQYSQGYGLSLQTLYTSLFVFDSGNRLFGFTTTPYEIFSTLTPNATTSYPLDMVFNQERLLFANGYVFGAYNASFPSYFSLPLATQFLSTIPQPYGGTVFAVGGPGTTAIVPSGTFSFRISYTKGFLDFPQNFVSGERRPDDDPASDIDIHVAVGATVVDTFPTWQIWGLTSPPPGYGITYLNVFMRFPGTSTWIQSPTLSANVIQPANAQIFTDYLQFFHFAVDAGRQNVAPFTLIPRFIENYANMLFMAGFSTQPSVLWHSEIASPEDVLAENFIEVRTDNGDQITCLKNFQSTLVIFKKKSIHELSGYSPDTLSIKDVSLQYGCVNNEAAVTFENRLWFVDQKGICEYNGPNTFIVSYDVEETFKTLDVTKAKAFYVKEETEVWFSFGSVSLVYSLEIKRWTIYDGFHIQNGQAAGMLDLGSSQGQAAFFKQGTSHYILEKFGESVFTDDGSNITLIAQSPYHKRLGDSTTEIWRRFFLNTDIPSTAFNVTLNMRIDYGSSVVSSLGFTQSDFQTRVDFGVPAKTFSVEWVIQTNQPVRVNGYTIEARYLRSV